MPSALAGWASELAWLSEEDEGLPSAIDGINVVLNRARLASFLAEFAEDKDVRDLLALDVLGNACGLPFTSTGVAEAMPGLIMRPFRIWEYAWLYKSLHLSAGGVELLDLGGPATHLSILAALAGCHVTSIDINPEFVHMAEECARVLKLDMLRAQVGDMRDLAEFPDGSFEAVLSCSVLEHLTAGDQQTALAEMERVLKPGGVIGLTFDYGPSAPGANEHLPPPHDPPANAAEVVSRFVRNGLSVIGNAFSEDPIPGSLFRHGTVKYTVASLFLGKAPAPTVGIPRCESTGSVLTNLVIEQLPYRVQRTAAGSNAELHNLRAQLEQTVTTMAGQQRRAASLEATAAERLDAMLQKDQAIAALDAELGNLHALLGQAMTTIAGQQQRAASLEATAAERLDAMLQKEQAITALDAQLRAAAERAASLEATAAERLDAMLQKELTITALDAQLGDLRTQLEQAMTTIAGQQQREASLEATAAERLDAMLQKEQAIAALDTELGDLRARLMQVGAERDRLQQEAFSLAERIRRFEEETWREYLSRRWERQQRPAAR